MSDQASKAPEAPEATAAMGSAATAAATAGAASPQANAAAAILSKVEPLLSRHPNVAGFDNKFGSLEHKAIGDAGARIVIATLGSRAARVQSVQIVDGFQMDYGDVVALAGDYFDSIAQLRAIASNTGPGAGTREEIAYELLTTVYAQHDRAREFGDEARTAADQRAHALDARNWNHFPNPEQGDTERPQSQKNAAYDALNRPLNACTAYRMNHALAVRAAWDAGSTSQPVGSAMAIEAFSNHFLTDAYASGHLRTARSAIKRYWDDKVPWFFARFKQFMANQIVDQILHNASAIDAPLLVVAAAKIAPGKVADMALSAIDGVLHDNGIPDFTFGDFVGCAVHDYDNKNGVRVRIAGQPDVELLYGDDALIDLSGNAIPAGARTLQLASIAVGRSITEVLKAYDAGAAGGDFKAFHATLVGADDLYAAERLFPQVLPDAEQAHPSLKWDAPDWQALFADPQFMEAVRITAEGKRRDFQRMVANMQFESADDEYQGRALHFGVVDALGSDPIGFVRRVMALGPA